MDTTFLLPVLDELIVAFGRGVMKGISQELANPAPTLLLPTQPLLPSRRAASSTSARSSPPGLRAAPAVGATVRYRQGRGTFEAAVVSVDEANGTATVKRATDGRQVVRPFAKLFAATTSSAAASAPPAAPVAGTAAAGSAG